MTLEWSGCAREVGPLFPTDAHETTAPELQVTQLVRAGCTWALAPQAPKSRPSQCMGPRGEVVGEEGGRGPGSPLLSLGLLAVSTGRAVAWPWSCGTSFIGHPTVSGSTSMSVRGRDRPGQSGLGAGAPRLTRGR